MWLVGQPFREIVPPVLSNVATPLPHTAARRTSEGAPRSIRLPSVGGGPANRILGPGCVHTNLQSHCRETSGAVAKGSHEWTAVDRDRDRQGEDEFGDNVGLQYHCARLIPDDFASRPADSFVH